MIRFILPAALLLPGCAMHADAPEPEHRTLTESIRFETSPCFGACPVYSVTVSSDGKGIFTGLRFTRVTGTQGFTVTRAQFDAFAKALAPYKGTLGGSTGNGNCKRMHTDDTGVRVTWTAVNGRSEMLSHYYGCDSPAFDAMEAVLKDAPKTLPIGDLIGP